MAHLAYSWSSQIGMSGAEALIAFRSTSLLYWLYRVLRSVKHAVVAKGLTAHAELAHDGRRLQTAVCKDVQQLLHVVMKTA